MTLVDSEHRSNQPARAQDCSRGAVNAGGVGRARDGTRKRASWPPGRPPGRRRQEPAVAEIEKPGRARKDPPALHPLPFCPVLAVVFVLHSITCYSSPPARVPGLVACQGIDFIFLRKSSRETGTSDVTGLRKKYKKQNRDGQPDRDL